MPKTQAPPTSLRVPEEQDARLAAFMARHKIKKRGTAILRLMDLGLQADEDVPKFVVRPGPAKSNTTAPSTSGVPLKEGARLAAPRDDRARWDIFRTAKAPKKAEA